MYILDINTLKKQAKVYLLFTILTIIFSIIYEAFSHEVYSNFMIFAFLIPLIAGSFISFALYFINKKDEKDIPSRIGNNLYNASIATLTFGSLFQGVLEIYGTTNSKIYIYPVVGISLLLISLIMYVIRIVKG